MGFALNSIISFVLVLILLVLFPLMVFCSSAFIVTQNTLVHVLARLYVKSWVAREKGITDLTFLILLKMNGPDGE